MEVSGRLPGGGLLRGGRRGVTEPKKAEEHGWKMGRVYPQHLLLACKGLDSTLHG